MSHISKTSIVVGSLLLSSLAEVAGAGDEFAIEVTREIQNDKGTFGKMTVDGSELCFTLEPAAGGGPEGKGPIPAGTYTGFLRYDKPDKWRVQLDNVPKFTGVQIHIGNVSKDTKGCILVGKERSPDQGSLSKSATAYAALKKAFYGTETPNSTPNKKITITVRDEFP